MEWIHCDEVMGLPPTLGRKTRFLLIMDEFLKFIEVHLIIQKNETQMHIKEFVGCMDQHQVTKLLTDLVAEFVEDKEFVKWLIGWKIHQNFPSLPRNLHNAMISDQDIIQWILKGCRFV